MLIASIIVFVLYITSIIVLKGIPNSISESYYLLGEGKLVGSLFTWFCFLTAFLLLPYWIDVTPENLQMLPFFACAGLIFVGVSPLFKSHQKKVHMTSAVLCFISAYIWIVLFAPSWLIIASFAMLLLSLFTKKRTFWLEVTAFITIFSALII